MDHVVGRPAGVGSRRDVAYISRRWFVHGTVDKSALQKFHGFRLLCLNPLKVR